MRVSSFLKRVTRYIRLIKKDYKRKLSHLIIASIISVLLFVSLVEITVRIGVLPDLTRPPEPPKIVNDPYLGKRFEPNQIEIDANGWRNEIALEQADIVSIGDSQTWGQSAPMSSAYPQQIGTMLGKKIYNISMGGYGPVEYLYLLEHAIAFEPEIITIGIYLGNDFVECYWAANRPPWHHLQDPGFDYQSNDFEPPELGFGEIIESIKNGTFNAVNKDIEEYKQNKNNEPNGRFPAESGKSWKEILFKSKAVGYLWHLVFRQFFRDDIDDYDKFSSKDKIYKQFEAHFGNQQAYVSYEDENVFFQMTPFIRSIVQNMEDPTVNDGFRICSISITNMYRFCRENDLYCLFVLIPTKELVYAPYLKSHGFEFQGYYSNLIESEDTNRKALLDLLNECGANVIDVLGPMQTAALEKAIQGELLYPHSQDGHPNELGYRVIADAIVDYFNQ